MIEWNGLEAIMVKMGFAQQWIFVIMGMVRKVSFSVLFNGNKLEEFKTSRGIRQCDPISPYLFLLTGEGLSCILKSRSESSSLQGLMVAPTTPAVNHLLFADDSLMFIKGNGESARDARDTLDA
jgi:hypothetical protein